MSAYALPGLTILTTTSISNSSTACEIPLQPLSIFFSSTNKFSAPTSFGLGSTVDWTNHCHHSNNDHNIPSRSSSPVSSACYYPPNPLSSKTKSVENYDYLRVNSCHFSTKSGYYFPMSDTSSAFGDNRRRKIRVDVTNSNVDTAQFVKSISSPYPYPPIVRRRLINPVLRNYERRKKRFLRRVRENWVVNSILQQNDEECVVPSSSSSSFPQQPQSQQREQQQQQGEHENHVYFNIVITYDDNISQEIDVGGECCTSARTYNMIRSLAQIRQLHKELVEEEFTRTTISTSTDYKCLTSSHSSFKSYQEPTMPHLMEDNEFCCHSNDIDSTATDSTDASSVTCSSSSSLESISSMPVGNEEDMDDSLEHDCCQDEEEEEKIVVSQQQQQPWLVQPIHLFKSTKSFVQEKSDFNRVQEEQQTKYRSEVVPDLPPFFQHPSTSTKSDYRSSNSTVCDSFGTSTAMITNLSLLSAFTQQYQPLIEQWFTTVFTKIELNQSVTLTNFLLEPLLSYNNHGATTAGVGTSGEIDSGSSSTASSSNHVTNSHSSKSIKLTNGITRTASTIIGWTSKILTNNIINGTEAHGTTPTRRTMKRSRSSFSYPPMKRLESIVEEEKMEED